MEMKKYKLGELFTIKQGFAFKSSNYVEKSKYRLCTLGNISETNSFRFNDAKACYYNDDFPKDFILNEEDLIIPLTEQTFGLFGNTAFIPKTNDFVFVLNQRVGKIIPNDNLINKYFLHYLLATNLVRKQIEATASGTTQRNTSPDKIAFVSVWIPNINIQNSIGDLLYKIENKIALNNRINAKLEQMAKRLYDYWFVQFDFPRSVSGEPCLHELSRTDDGNARSDFPGADGKPYKSNGGKMVWNEVLKRKIPEGWEVKKISEILDCEIPGDWGEENIKGKHDYKVNCIRGCDMVDMTDLPTRYILQANAKKLLQADDFVIEISGGSPTQSTGRMVQVTEEIINRFDNKIICSNFCHGVRVANKNYISYFYQMWNMFNDNGVFFNFEGKTSGLKNFQFDTFIDQKWYFPSEDLAKRFNETAMKFRKEIDKNESENKRLSQLRDKLLPLLMNGQVVVK